MHFRKGLPVLLAMMLCFSAAALAEGQPAPTATPKPRPRLVIDPNIGSTPTPPPPEPGIAIPGWVAFKLPAGTTDAEVALYNPEDNADWYYLTFEMHLAKPEGADEETEEEVIFSTGLVPPGMYCTKVELTRALEAGEYDAIMYVQPYRMNEALSATNNAVYNLKLIVE